MPMTWTYTPEYYKAYTRDTWNESAGSYGPIQRVLDQYTPELLAAAKPRPGERVLDVATGPGEPALTLAKLVAPGGRVLGIDLSERMIDVARERAKRAGVHNAEFLVMDAESLDVPHGTYDLVTCRFGLQIVTEPEDAIKEAVRALRSGGRLAASVWSTGDRVPFIHAIVGPMLDFAEPDETGYLPTPYEMGGAGELAALFRKHGLANVTESRVTHSSVFESVDAYLEAVLKGTPLGHSLSEEDADVQQKILARTRENLRRYQTDRGIVLEGEAVIVAGEKPR